MVKKKKANLVVGSNNIVRTAIPKQLDNMIVEFQIELTKKHNKKVSKQWAALQMSIEWNKKRKKNVKKK